jgi:hypothetical protein
MNGNTARVTAGQKPPEFIEQDGKRYRPVWRETTVEEDRKRGEQVYIIVAMGHEIEDDEAQSE